MRLPCNQLCRAPFPPLVFGLALIGACGGDARTTEAANDASAGNAIEASTLSSSPADGAEDAPSDASAFLEAGEAADSNSLGAGGTAIYRETGAVDAIPSEGQAAEDALSESERRTTEDAESDSGDDAGWGGSTGTGRGGAVGQGGVGQGGVGAGSDEAGGSEAGGSEAGGSNLGGFPLGGGSSIGGNAHSALGGSNSGGSSSGGSNSGGSSSGGSDLGGSSSGGSDLGGSSSGGSNSGGDGAGGNEVDGGGSPDASPEAGLCATNNGGCDSLRPCQDEGGSRICGPCPPGCTEDGDTRCTLPSTACTPNPCQNEGRCTVTSCGGDFVCQCPSGYSGPYCEVPSPNFGFFVFSDVHIGYSGSDALFTTALEQMRQIDPAAEGAFSVGDHVYQGTKSEWDGHVADVTPTFKPAATSFGWGARYLAAVGNHDTMGGNWYANWSAHLPGQVGLGQTSSAGVYYAVNYRNALFVVLDSEHTSATTLADQTAQLASLLHGSVARFKFVLFHRPVYPCNTDTTVHAPFAAGLPWIDLAEKNGVDVVINGHTHVFSRTCRMNHAACTTDGTGVTQLELGTASAYTRAVNVNADLSVAGVDSDGATRKDIYNCAATNPRIASFKNSDHTFCHIRVADCKAGIDCYQVASGNITPFDSFEIDHCQ